MVTVHEIFNSVNAMIRKLASSKYRLYSHQKKPKTGRRRVARRMHSEAYDIVLGGVQLSVRSSYRCRPRASGECDYERPAPHRDYDVTACNHFRCSVQIHINGGSAYS
jgi:hypothetical protein